MRPTRRFLATAGLGGVLAALAVVLARPALLFGAAGLGAWLLSRQYAFLRAVARAADGLSVDQSVSPARVSADEPATVTLTAAIDDPAPVPLSIAASPPVAATGSTRSERTLRIDPGGRTAETAFPVTLPVAGAFTFGPPRVVATDAFGLLAESFPSGPAPTVTAEPRVPRNVHVGEGGDRIAAAFGEHPTAGLGPGLEAAEVREYVPGDAASRIDWKATARLDHPHVREYEAETDRRTVLLLDHREATGVGPAGETTLDYLRQVALAVLARARALDDPVGLYTVGDEGATGERAPAATVATYAAIRRRLQGIEPTRQPDVGSTGGGRPDGPAAARRAATRLEGDDSAFGTTLLPYFAATDPYVRRLEGNPLFVTVRTYLSRLRGTLWTVILTDDSDRSGVRESVKAARRGDDHVLVFIAPAVLFEPGGLADAESAYDRYVEFEAFRRELARLDRVSAFEVAPGDRFDAVLAAGRERRAETTGRRT